MTAIPMLDLEQSRYNMLSGQIRTWDVLDAHALAAIAQVPRELFVPDALQALAFSDSPLPLGEGEEMLAPRIAARLLQAANVQPGDKILEVGTGSGYLTACLATLGHQVYTQDIQPSFTEAAQARFAALKLGNITARTGDIFATGWGRDGTYDVIVVTGSLPLFDPEILACLRRGGRLCVIVGAAPAMQARLYTKISATECPATVMFETVVPPLRHAPQPPSFSF
jgi:protein-L-isoaspartate(D-aspartate) O-methyltransferase